VENNLIFDLGFHLGCDSKYYISKGYQIIAVEANPNLCSSWNHNNNLILLNKAISETSYNNNEVSFFIRKDNLDWSSCNKKLAEQQNGKSEECKVKTITLIDLIHEYGTPYYIKTDVEGCDLTVAEQLSWLEEKPKYVSFELNKVDYFDIFYYLKKAGYTKFQLRNQENNDKYCSGYFGEYLPKDKWVDFDEALSRYLKFRELRILDRENLSMGWLDIHASQ